MTASVFGEQQTQVQATSAARAIGLASWYQLSLGGRFPEGEEEMVERPQEEKRIGGEAPVDKGACCGEIYSTPAVDIYETDAEIVVLADLPGVASEELDIDLDGEVLTITGKATAEEEKGTVLLSEYSGRAYCRSFYLASLVDRKRISASMNDGVLTIVLPKSETKIARRIVVATQ